MAKEQHMWLQRHAHESSTVSYGQFGTPVYHESSHSWKFSRNDGFTEIQDEDDVEQQNGQQRLKILTGPEVLLQPTRIDASNLEESRNRVQAKDFPVLAGASSLLKVIDKENTIGIAAPHQGSRIAFGSALSLSADGVDSGNLVVSAIAYATGLGADTLRLACLGQEHLQFSIRKDTTLHARVPSLIGHPQAFLSGTEPILQLSFSSRNADGHGDTLLLVRRASHTSILEPLLRREASFHVSDQQSSSLDPNVLVTLHTSITGGHCHVDAAFHPLDHRKVAVVDEEGNWSIWEIRGRRSTTARILYQARLRATGKVFSWRHRKRPAGIGLFFDGWHKVVWTSSDGRKIDRLLVCNRQTIKLFTLAGQESCPIDPRLDLGKASYILDVRSGPMINVCLILTTSKLIVFDIAQQEWKDSVSSKGPALLCAFEHFQSSASVSLKITEFQLGNELLLGLYSTDFHRLSMRQLVFQELDGKLFMTISDAWSVPLSVQLSGGRVAAVILIPSEVAYAAGQIIPHRQEFLRIIIQHENLAIHSFWATVRSASPSQKWATRQKVLKFPPNRSLQRKSGLRVDDTDDDDDGFIVSDTDDGDHVLPPPVITGAARLARLKAMKHVDEIHTEIEEQRANNAPKPTLNATEVSKKLESHLQDSIISYDTTSGCRLLLDLTESDSKITDVEAESDGLQQIISSLNANATNCAISSCHERSAESLMSTYNTIFDTFVEGLPSDVPDRARVQKERQYRGIALEQYLSSHTTRRISGETDAAAERTRAAPDASQMIFSDPLQQNDPQSQHFQPISASQPLPQTGPEPSNTSVIPSALLDSLSQIQSYTRITHNLGEILTEDSDMLDHFSSVFSHLPMSFEENPDDYDYQDRVMAIVAEKAEVRGSDVQSGNRAHRKATRPSRIQKRAEDFSSGLQGKNQNIRGGTALVDKEPGNIERGVSFRGQRSQDKNAESLPIRSSGERFPGHMRHDKVAQSQNGYHLSDGHVPAESSSQIAMQGNLTLTQPERGAFANRAEAKSQDKTRKKKKRMAGF